MKKTSLILALSAICTMTDCSESKSSKILTEAKTADSSAINRINPTQNESKPSTLPAVEQPDRQSSGPVAGTQDPGSEATTPPAVPLQLEEGSLDVEWIHGSANCAQDKNPPLQVHEFNKNLIILRQNKCLNFEAPFLYLVFGDQKALLLDSGATNSAATFPIRQTVEGLMVEHYGADNRSKIELVVAHSHGHGDHRLGDQQFKGQPATSVVGANQPAVAAFFKINNWPEQIVDFDLGGRILKVIPIPGHEASHIGLYDAQTGLLFSGDSVYPGRLFIDDFEAYRASIARLQAFLSDKTVKHILGAHVEMSTTPGKDFAAGSTFQPNEHPLELTKEALSLLNSELIKLGNNPRRTVLGEFIITP